jgi:hypothetical protein
MTRMHLATPDRQGLQPRHDCREIGRDLQGLKLNFEEWYRIQHLWPMAAWEGSSAALLLLAGFVCDGKTAASPRKSISDS